MYIRVALLRGMQVDGELREVGVSAVGVAVLLAGAGRRAAQAHVAQHRQEPRQRQAAVLRVSAGKCAPLPAFTCIALTSSSYRLLQSTVFAITDLPIFGSISDLPIDDGRWKSDVIFTTRRDPNRYFAKLATYQ